MLTEEQNRIRAEALAVAQSFNARYGGELLIVAPPPKEVLPEHELAAGLASLPPGWYSARSIFFHILKRAPTHGESVAFGRALAKFGCEPRREPGGARSWRVGQ